MISVDAIRKRHSLATPGPWHWEVFALHIPPLVRGHLADPSGQPIITPRDVRAVDVLESDADFIAHAWKDIQDLLVLVEAQKSLSGLGEID